MAHFKLEQFRGEIRGYLMDNYEDFCKWLILEGMNIREGVSDEVRKDNICYGIFFHLPYDLKSRMRNVCECEDIPIANIMISVIKGMGVYNNIK